jgi:imidazole glycerol-phosphate synthase subunit HisH
MITIVDYGAGNICSIQNMLKKIGVQAVTASDEGSLAKAEKLILPGVGAFDTCAQKLQESGLKKVLHKKVTEEGVPVLGICVGMQLMMEESEEGVLPGLGWIKGRTVKFNKESIPADLKIPHMGWSEVELNKPSRLFDDMYDAPRFYFVHSYYVEPADNNDVLLYAAHGNKFTAALERNNIMGVQFHPEKSHKYGMKLLENFVKNY